MLDAESNLPVPMGYRYGKSYYPNEYRIIVTIQNYVQIAIDR